jgi:uncharacterized protein (DUF1499 family)
MRLDQAAKDDRAVLIAGDLASGFMTYVARSRVFGFPDAVSIRLHPRGTRRASTSSRARRSGDYDWGVNAARVERWIAAAGP